MIFKTDLKWECPYFYSKFIFERFGQYLKKEGDIDRDISLAKNDIDRDISLAKNNIDRDISLAENDIDRDISLAKNYIDREGF